MSELASLLEVAGPLAAGGAGAAYAKVKVPRAHWAAIGLPVTLGRIMHSYAEDMEACGLTVEPPLWKAMAARMGGDMRQLKPAPPRITRVTPTTTGLRVRLRLRPGQSPADVTEAAERLQHAWSVHAVRVVELAPRTVELRLTGFDLLRRVHLPARQVAKVSGLLRVPVALCEDGSIYVRDFRKRPNGLTVGALGTGKSMYGRNLVVGLAPQPVALVGIDCKRGVEQGPFAPRLSALATDPDTALDLLRVLVGEVMEERYDLICAQNSISGRVDKEDITSDIWSLPEEIRPAPVVMVIDEIAELFLAGSKAEEARRMELVTLLIRYAQLARAAGMFIEVMGQRFSSELGKGATMLRAQLTNRIAHRVNDLGTAGMTFGEIAPQAVMSAVGIKADRPGTAVAGDTSGAWSRIRTPELKLADAAAACARYAHLVPELPALAPFRPITGIPATPEEIADGTPAVV